MYHAVQEHLRKISGQGSTYVDHRRTLLFWRQRPRHLLLSDETVAGTGIWMAAAKPIFKSRLRS